MEPIKILAAGAGAYLLYQYWQNSSAAPVVTGPTLPTQADPTTQPPATPAAPSTQAGIVIQAPPATGPAFTGAGNNGMDIPLKRAAAFSGWASEAGTAVLNWHQWNYYRREYNPALATPAPEDVGQGDGSTLLTAQQYHAVLGAAGLAGITLNRLRRYGRTYAL